MAKKTTAIDIGHLPEVLELAEEVRNSKRSRLLACGERDAAVLSPAEPASKPQQRRAFIGIWRG